MTMPHDLFQTDVNQFLRKARTRTERAKIEDAACMIRTARANVSIKEIRCIQKNYIAFRILQNYVSFQLT